MPQADVLNMPKKTATAMNVPVTLLYGSSAGQHQSAEAQQRQRRQTEYISSGRSPRSVAIPTQAT